ncbi:FKBP-type peptidyl-prolyl cis-trans isomerase [Ichthyenterobacterium sp. W332]|uniref:Peptidyl-prolyl cis-trans isomerase n=1 Tax=Microcosmobacter mediterraneus TaxID=3075607 RepID=A0ABU2YMR8_9FLAO|nr:FKBP-type peptidyl-prolyl cis-trans isomerase [Ichthyenterobacterium sp. W332]MDT0559461.1 FKBP-type peptidyl-prolyl cis-trans isomerase [Ichthyenterobacterium sp. W332]
MKIRSLGVLVLTLSLLIASCRPDDGGSTTPVANDRTEQQVIDDAALVEYLNTHYYNATTFDGSGGFTIEDIDIMELPKDDDDNYLPLPDPDNNNLLIEDVEEIATTFLDVDYKYYILRLGQNGGGESPKFSDDIRVRYSGNLEDGTIFDSAVTPVEFDMTNVIQGWNRVMPQYNTAESFEIIGGEVIYTNYGLGVMFLPSGLSYFATPPFGVPAYANLVFKFELLQFEENDHDNDGIPSYLEDLDLDLNLFTDDTDENSVPNYIDNDDDGDGVLTINEDENGDGDPTNDIGENGIPRYLDPEETDSFETED